MFLFFTRKRNNYEPNTNPYICIAADDTKIHKTGRKFLKLVTIGCNGAQNSYQSNLGNKISSVFFDLSSEKYFRKSIPIRFIDVPSIKKPGSKGTKEDWEEYKKATKKYNFSSLFVSGSWGSR